MWASLSGQILIIMKHSFINEKNTGYLFATSRQVGIIITNDPVNISQATFSYVYLWKELVAIESKFLIPHLGAISRVFGPWGSMSNADYGGSRISRRYDRLIG